MDLEEYFPLLMFPALLLGILSGFPVAFVLSAVGLLFGLFGHYWLDIFPMTDFGFISSKIFGVIGNVTLIAVPLFIFMGITLEKSGIAEELLGTTERLFSRVRGGLLFGLIFVGALLAASTGIVGATVVTMGALSLPPLLKRNYDPKLCAGTICASGTLGQIIPPSIVLILLADMMNIAVADLFAGAIVPGLLLVLGYALYVFIQVSVNPSLVPVAIQETDTRASLREILGVLIPPLILVILVLGSILLGIASPTEAAGCGAITALGLALFRRKLTLQTLREISERTTYLTAMVFTLLFGAQVFAVVFRGMYGDEVLIECLEVFSEEEALLFWLVMGFFFLLGFFLDFLEICFIFVPVITPMLTQELDMPAIWIAVLIAINLQTSFLTPPFGFSLFYLRGVATKSELSTMDIYRGVIPFVLIQLAVLALVYAFPELALSLPRFIWGSN
ncbi:MAG: TRAP transporter large permease subunit [Bdellovibrionales bacterium]|nr:TRAP transporter large permease subunit [Bdellovibrionales bacterium]